MEDYRSLILQKKELVFRLLRLSNDTPLNHENTEENAEKYIGLVEARDIIIEQLKTLNDDLGLREPPEMTDELALINQEIKDMIEQVTRMESDIRKKTTQIMTALQKDINDLNSRKKISGKYEAAMPDVN